MRKNLLHTLILLISFSFVSNAQDCISNFSIETQCNDAFNYTASISFDHTLENNDWISILDRNGVDYGYFNPNEQPITLDILLPNSLMNEVEFIFISKEDASCVVQSPTTFVSCNSCALEANILSTECVEGTENYLLYLDLINNGTMSASNYFVKHKNSGEQYGPFASAAPGQHQTIELELPNNLQGDFSIFDATNLCRAIISASNECTPVPTCSISNVTFETECIDTENSKVFISFDHEAIAGDWVNIKDSNGVNHGQFKANEQPLIVEVALSNTPMNEFSFRVESAQDSTCFSSSEKKMVSCYECEIQAELKSTECTAGNETYRLTLEVASMGASTVEDFKLVHAETGRFMGLFNNYAPSRPRLIALSISTDLQGSFIVSDANDLCAQTVDVQIDCSMPLCYFSDISFETECTNGNNFSADIEFGYEQEVTDMVSVKDIHGNDYGVYDASQQPLRVDVTLQDTDSREFGFILTCAQDANCIGESALQTITCVDCNMEASTISTECIPDSDKYKLTLEVNNNNSSNTENYKLIHTATGQFVGLYNNYSPGSSRPISATLSTSLQGSFTISDESGTCETTTNVQVDCTTPFCYLSNVNFETECVGVNNFTANIEFEYEAEVTDMVSVKDIHGIEYGVFDASQQPLSVDVVLQDTDSREFGFVLTSTEAVDCFAESVLQTIECINCELEAEVMHHECELNGETYHMAVEVTNNGDTDGAKYLVTHTATGQFIGAYSHFGSSAVRHIDFYNPTDKQGEFTINIEGTNCSTTINIDVDCTPVEPCSLSNASLEYECLDQNQYQVTLRYDHAGIEGDTVRIEDGKGNLFGQYNVNDQPVVLNIDDTNLTINNFVVSIKNPNDETCLLRSEALKIECESSAPCEVEALEVSSTECNNDETYNLTATYSLTNSESEFVSISINGGSPKLYNNTGAIHLDNITGRDNSDYDIIELCSNDNNDCCRTLEYITPNCVLDIEECTIGDITIVTECLDNGYFSANITFPYEASHQNGVSIQGNGISYGLFDGHTQPIVLDELMASDFDQWEFVIIDNKNETCKSEVQIGQVNCEDNIVKCSFENMEVKNIKCVNNEEYEMTLDFDFDSEENMEFSCYVNGEMLVATNTSLLPLKMTGMSTNGSNNVDVVTICMDGLVEECCKDLVYESPNCLSNSVVDNSLLDGVSISPNPASDMVYISNIPQDVIGLTIVDNMGRRIKDLSNDQNFSLDVSDYQSGLYTIQFFTADNRVLSKRFMKL